MSVLERREVDVAMTVHPYHRCSERRIRWHSQRARKTAVGRPLRVWPENSISNDTTGRQPVSMTKFFQVRAFISNIRHTHCNGSRREAAAEVAGPKRLKSTELGFVDSMQ